MEKLALIFLFNFHCELMQFAKIENKKVMAENQCEKHKKSTLYPNPCYNKVCYKETAQYFIKVLRSDDGRSTLFSLLGEPV